MTLRLARSGTLVSGALLPASMQLAQHPDCLCTCIKLSCARQEDLQGRLGKAAQC